jgi:hypothetical protein
LVGVERILEAVLGDGAVRADRLSALNLLDGRASVAHREEKLGVNGEAGCFIAPIHGYSLICRGFRDNRGNSTKVL